MPWPITSRMPTGPLYAVAVLLFGLASSLAASAQPAPLPSPSPPQVQELLQLLQDPVVRPWVDEQRKPAGVPATPTAKPTASEMMTQRIAGFREHLASLASAIPSLPGEFRSASRQLLAELQGRSRRTVQHLRVQHEPSPCVLGRQGHVGGTGSAPDGTIGPWACGLSRSAFRHGRRGGTDRAGQASSGQCLRPDGEL
jgi:hypothetical protein